MHSLPAYRSLTLTALLALAAVPLSLKIAAQDAPWAYVGDVPTYLINPVVSACGDLYVEGATRVYVSRDTGATWSVFAEPGGSESVSLIGTANGGFLLREGLDEAEVSTLPCPEDPAQVYRYAKRRGCLRYRAVYYAVYLDGQTYVLADLPDSTGAAVLRGLWPLLANVSAADVTPITDARLLRVRESGLYWERLPRLSPESIPTSFGPPPSTDSLLFSSAVRLGEADTLVTVWRRVGGAGGFVLANLTLPSGTWQTQVVEAGSVKAVYGGDAAALAVSTSAGTYFSPDPRHRPLRRTLPPGADASETADYYVGLSADGTLAVRALPFVGTEVLTAGGAVRRGRAGLGDGAEQLYGTADGDLVAATYGGGLWRFPGGGAGGAPTLLEEGEAVVLQRDTVGANVYRSLLLAGGGRVIVRDSAAATDTLYPRAAELIGGGTDSRILVPEAGGRSYIVRDGSLSRLRRPRGGFYAPGGLAIIGEDTLVADSRAVTLYTPNGEIGVTDLPLVGQAANVRGFRDRGRFVVTYDGDRDRQGRDLLGAYYVDPFDGTVDEHPANGRDYFRLDQVGSELYVSLPGEDYPVLSYRDLGASRPPKGVTPDDYLPRPRAVARVGDRLYVAGDGGIFFREIACAPATPPTRVTCLPDGDTLTVAGRDITARGRYTLARANDGGDCPDSLHLVVLAPGATYVDTAVRRYCLAEAERRFGPRPRFEAPGRYTLHEALSTAQGCQLYRESTIEIADFETHRRDTAVALGSMLFGQPVEAIGQEVRTFAPRDDGGCADLVIYVVTGTVGASAPAELRDVLIYPNPLARELYVEALPADGSTTRLEVVDLAGRVVLTAELDPRRRAQSVSVDALASGAYFIRLIRDGGPRTWRVIKR